MRVGNNGGSRSIGKLGPVRSFPDVGVAHRLPLPAEVMKVALRAVFRPADANVSVLGR